MRFTEEQTELVKQLGNVIVCALVARGHQAEFTLDYDDRKHGIYGCQGVTLNRVKIPLKFKFLITRPYYHRPSTTPNKMQLVVDWLRVDYNVVLKSRVFRMIDKREHGLDIEKVCDHLEKWATTLNQEKHRRDTSDQALKQWVGIAESLQVKFPCAWKRLKVVPTPKGLKLKGQLGLADIELILGALENNT